MDASTIAKQQQAVEHNGDGRPLNLPGIYREKTSGKEIITSPDLDSGVAQADAIIAIGDRMKQTWERIGDVPSAVELKETNERQEIRDAALDALEEGKKSEARKVALKQAIEEAKAAK